MSPLVWKEENGISVAVNFAASEARVTLQHGCAAVPDEKFLQEALSRKFEGMRLGSLTGGVSPETMTDWLRDWWLDNRERLEGEREARPRHLRRIIVSPELLATWLMGQRSDRIDQSSCPQDLEILGLSWSRGVPSHAVFTVCSAEFRELFESDGPAFFTPVYTERHGAEWNREAFQEEEARAAERCEGNEKSPLVTGSDVH